MVHTIGRLFFVVYTMGQLPRFPAFPLCVSPSPLSLIFACALCAARAYLGMRGTPFLCCACDYYYCATLMGTDSVGATRRERHAADRLPVSGCPPVPRGLRLMCLCGSASAGLALLCCRPTGSALPALAKDGAVFTYYKLKMLIDKGRGYQSM